MITLISRQSVFSKYSKITEEIAQMQRLFYDGDPEYFASEVDRAAYQALFDAKDIFREKTTKFCKVISIDHDDIETFTDVLSRKLLDLFAELRIKDLVMISHCKMNFVGNINNTYPPLLSAFEKFEKITKDIKYDEAVEFEVENLPELIEIVFWIARGDAAGPEFIFLFDKDEKLAINLCKEGNVHAIEFEKEILPNTILKRYGWELVKGGCYNSQL
ncbi:hypothetical protein [Pedobacter immunditicola]|uniref:hypothetical protein n=1 Tax=Pedobacter immunditicola TaxID=3133440 RepID=UPI0030B77190